MSHNRSRFERLPNVFRESKSAHLQVLIVESNYRILEKRFLQVNTSQGWVETPVRYLSGNLGWDAPARVPAYLRGAVLKEMDRVETPYDNDWKRRSEGTSNAEPNSSRPMETNT